MARRNISMKMNNAIATWRRTVGEDAPLTHLWRSVQSLDDDFKKVLLDDAEKLSNELLGECRLIPEKDRIAFVKLMLTLLPKSKPLIERFVFSNTSNAQEIQFTLWCFLDEIWDDKEMAEKHAGFAIELLKRYILTDPGDDALQEWMALDLIFEHLPKAVRLKVIKDLLDSRNASEKLKLNLRARVSPRCRA